jgi:hypothetical protein
LINARGIGTIIRARHPRRVPAHCTPKLLNICLENKGKAAPTADLMIVFAAKTDAALESMSAQSSAGAEEKGRLTMSSTNQSDN